MNVYDGIAVGVLGYAVWLWAVRRLVAFISPDAREQRRMRREMGKWAK